MLILSATLAVFVYGLIAPILGALLPSYGLTPEQQGSLAMLQALGLVVASLSAGPIIDVKGNKSALVAGLALIVISLASAPIAGGYAGLLIVYFVLGVGGGTAAVPEPSSIGLLASCLALMLLWRSGVARHHWHYRFIRRRTTQITCARIDPSVSSTIECTTDCGWITTSI